MTFELKNKYTRKIQREFNDLLLRDAKMSDGNIETKPENIGLANDFLVMSLYGLTQDELDNLWTKEYAVMLENAGKE